VRRPFSRARALAWMREICLDLGLPPASLHWSQRIKNGKYKGFGSRIKSGPNCWRGTANSLLHEIAHHAAKRPPTSEERKYGTRRPHHGEEFYQAMLRVEEVALRRYGHEYDWLTEYKTVRSRRLSDAVAREAAGRREGTK
jgi:hypothetical protein